MNVYAGEKFCELRMETCRVLIVSGHPLFAEGVFHLINDQAGLQVVGVTAPGAQAAVDIQSLRPDVVVVDMDARAHTAALPTMLHHYPGIKFIGLSLDNNDIRVYYQHVKKSTGVDALVEAIREPLEWKLPEQPKLRLLAITQGTYGQRIVENIRRHAPEHWQVQQWVVPPSLPGAVEADDGRSFLPPMLPAADLVLSLSESPRVAVLLPDVVRMTGARSVIAPVDNTAWLPADLIGQLYAGLAQMGVAAVFPKPFCSLTESEYNLRDQGVKYSDGLIAEFARYLGRPALRASVEDGTGKIAAIEVQRDSACGCARYVAGQLIGLGVDEAQARAGLLHQRFPCLAGVTVDPDYAETLLNISNYLLKEGIQAQPKITPTP